MLRRLLLTGAISLAGAAAYAADTKISDLPAASALGGTEQLPCVQTGTTDKCTATQIKTFANVPAGSDTQIQFNNAGAFGASSGLTWTGTFEVFAAGKAFYVLNGTDAILYQRVDGAGLIIGDSAGGAGGVVAGLGFAGGSAFTGADVWLMRPAAGMLGIETDASNLTSWADLRLRNIINSGGTQTFDAAGIQNGTCTFGGVFAATGGNTNGTFTSSTGTCTSGQTFTIKFLTTAPTGWNCTMVDRTTPAAVPLESSTTTTTVTMKENATTLAAGDVIQFTCQGY